MSKPTKFQQNNPYLEPMKMAHIRHIKPDFFTHEGVTELSPLARLLWIGLWTISDKNGVFLWKSKTIKLKLLPFDDCDINSLLKEIEDHDFIRRYNYEGQDYGYIPNWRKHQAIGTKEAKRHNTYPAPPIDGGNDPNSGEHIPGNVPAHAEYVSRPEDKDKEVVEFEVEGKRKNQSIDQSNQSNPDRLNERTIDPIQSIAENLSDPTPATDKANLKALNAAFLKFGETQFRAGPESKPQLLALIETRGLQVVLLAVENFSMSQDDWSNCSPAAIFCANADHYIEDAKRQIELSNRGKVKNTSAGVV